MDPWYRQTYDREWNEAAAAVEGLSGLCIPCHGPFSINSLVNALWYRYTSNMVWNECAEAMLGYAGPRRLDLRGIAIVQRYVPQLRRFEHYPYCHLCKKFATIEHMRTRWHGHKLRLLDGCPLDEALRAAVAAREAMRRA